jgi:NTP pyrophosphatase (non-canonical NTP hydrolase)
VEAGELLELFQWTTDRQPTKIVDGRLENVKNEIADIFLYLIRLADVLNVDLIEAANAKIELNAAKYPVEKSRGNASKYTEL